MLKILTTEQIRKADRATMEREPIESVDLMERAGNACADWLISRYATDRPFVIIAGVGNNGGDALVVARKLIEKEYSVKTFVVRYSEKFATDLQVNFDRLVRIGHEVQYILEEGQFPAISSDTVIVDGLFGSGLNRPVEGLAATCIGQINASIADVIAIDIPSGLFADAPTPKGSAVISASATLSFEVPKLSFMLPGADEWTGTWEILPIGLDPLFIAEAKTNLYLVDHLKAYAPFFLRDKFDHKGKFGHTLIVAGSHGKMGAAVLTTRAALRSGSGLVTSYVPHVGYTIMQASVPEAMCIEDDFSEILATVPDIKPYTTIAVGPGLGTAKKTRRMLKKLCQEFNRSMVLDADAINLMAEAGDAAEWVPKHSVLTPHIGEFERLFGTSKNEFERLVKLRKEAQSWKVFILLKGAHSALATPDGAIYFNDTGNPGMAKGGSGDVLTGIMAAMLAQTGDPFTAAVCGMFIHGLAGDLAEEFSGTHGMIASDIVDNIGEAISQSLSIDK